MILKTPIVSVSSDRTYPPRTMESGATLLDTTMGGGTALLVGSASSGQGSGDYVLLGAEVILEYEQVITDLRRQLIHYKRLVAHLTAPRESQDEYDNFNAVQPVDAQSTKIVNSIVQAHVPQAAIFREFDEGEL